MIYTDYVDAWGEKQSRSLNEVLKLLGLRHKKQHKNTGKHLVFDAEEKTIFIGDAHDTWKWLFETGRATHGEAPA